MFWIYFNKLAKTEQNIVEEYKNIKFFFEDQYNDLIRLDSEVCCTFFLPLDLARSTYAIYIYIYIYIDCSIDHGKLLEAGIASAIDSYQTQTMYSYSILMSNLPIPLPALPYVICRAPEQQNMSNIYPSISIIYS